MAKKTKGYKAPKGCKQIKLKGCSGNTGKYSGYSDYTTWK